LSEPSNVQAKARTYLEKSLFQQPVNPSPLRCFLGTAKPVPFR
jgi:hypothetical protein